jgi:hypothetical protein
LPTRAQELLYLLTIKRLKETGLTIVTDLGDAAPAGPPRLEAGVEKGSALNSANNAMGKRMEQVRGPCAKHMQASKPCTQGGAWLC